MDPDLGKFVDRRLHPVRVAVNLMNQQFEIAKGSKEIVVDSQLFASIVSTMELFIEDFSERYRGFGGGQEQSSGRKFVEAAKTTIKI